MIFVKWGCDNSSTPICSASLGSRSHYIYAQVKKKEKKKEKKKKRVGTMPCVYISTNVCLDGLDLDPIFADATKAVAALIGRPENFVMVILKGSLAISFGGNKEPAAYTEIVAMGGINTPVKRKLIATLGDILHKRLSIPPARFFLKVFDTTAHAIPKL